MAEASIASRVTDYLAGKMSDAKEWMTSAHTDGVLAAHPVPDPVPQANPYSSNLKRRADEMRQMGTGEEPR